MICVVHKILKKYYNFSNFLYFYCISVQLFIEMPILIVITGIVVAIRVENIDKKLISIRN